MKKILGILMAIWLCQIPIESFAAAPYMSALPEGPYSLTVDFMQDKDNGDSEQISGAEVSTYRIADITVKGGSVECHCLDAYKSVAEYDEDGREITFDGIDSDTSRKIAESCERVKTNKAASGVTGDDGRTVLSVENAGIYLVVESSRSGEAGKYQNTAPFLVMVPSVSDDSGTYSWVANPLVYPKTAVAKVPENQPNNGGGGGDTTPSVKPQTASTATTGQSAATVPVLGSENSQGTVLGETRNNTVEKPQPSSQTTQTTLGARRTGESIRDILYIAAACVFLVIAFITKKKSRQTNDNTMEK